jgi:nucleotide-binding universal stress UspA family protein
MPFEKILVAIDGSECSDRAFATAIELANLTRAKLTPLAIEGPLPAYAATLGEVDEVKREKDRFFNALATAAREQAARAGVEVDVDIRAGHAAEVISDFAGAGHYDLVVLGHRGHFLRDHLLGSTADRVAEHAPCPVMIVQ